MSSGAWAGCFPVQAPCVDPTGLPRCALEEGFPPWSPAISGPLPAFHPSPVCTFPQSWQVPCPTAHMPAFRARVPAQQLGSVAHICCPVR